MQVAAGQAVAGVRNSNDLGGAITAGRTLADSLRQARAAGRMVVEANPVVLAGNYLGRIGVAHLLDGAAAAAAALDDATRR